MPKRKADDSPGSVSKAPRDQKAVRIEQSEYILNNGFITSVSCEYCLSLGVDCTMDRSRRYSKCSMCTRQGRLCKREFHTGSEWDLLKRAEEKIAQDVEKNENSKNWWRKNHDNQNGAYYHGNIVRTEFDEWIESGMID